jgi:hypothetical protein
MEQFKLPTETVELPSKGIIYPKDNPLSSGKVEMKYMTAKEEDILTNQNYIKNGTVLDKLLTSLIVSEINYNDLITGDKNALLIAARVLGYGKDYSFKYIDDGGNSIEANVDLSELEDKPLALSELNQEGVNEFNFSLPHSGNEITYKLLTHSDEKSIDKEITGLKKVTGGAAPEATTRLKYLITSIGGDREKKTIREFVDKYMLARDSRALREEYRRVAPDVELTYFPEDATEGIPVPISLNFFWPDASI